MRRMFKTVSYPNVVYPNLGNAAHFLALKCVTSHSAEVLVPLVTRRMFEV
jgi:hypothetical protein